MSDDWANILIPMIRTVLPMVTAESIVNVQQMHNPFNNTKFIKVNQSKDHLCNPPDGYVTIDVITDISIWIEKQPIHMWKYGDVPAYSGHMDRFTISEELYTWLVVKWT